MTGLMHRTVLDPDWDSRGPESNAASQSRNHIAIVLISRFYSLSVCSHAGHDSGHFQHGCARNILPSFSCKKKSCPLSLSASPFPVCGPKQTPFSSTVLLVSRLDMPIEDITCLAFHAGPDATTHVFNALASMHRLVPCAALLG